MHTRFPGCRRGLAVLLWLALVLGAGGVVAQSPAQMELFRQLPQSEQQRIIRDLGVLPGQADPSNMPRTPNGATGSDESENMWRDGPLEREPILDPVTGLPLFGYELFRAERGSMRPSTDIPVPVGYLLGPGDVVVAQMFGRTQGTYSLVVNRDGAINFPELGPINVAGLSFDHVRTLLQERVSQQLIGTSLSLTLGELRSIQVFVLGDATSPGSYSVSSLSTITHALLISGGISPVGSLRRVQLKRNGEHLTTLDLYDLLLRGDNRNDLRLQPEDVIFVPPVGAQAAIDGEVNRPGVYELRGGETAADLVAMAGGLTRAAFPGGATLERIDPVLERRLEELDLSAAAGRARDLLAGDFIQVPEVLERVENAVHLAGQVFRPRKAQYRPGMRISDLIPSLRELKPLADINYVLIRRETLPRRQVVALSADLAAALEAPGSSADLELAPGDRVFVFHLRPLPIPEVQREEETRELWPGQSTNAQRTPELRGGVVAEGPQLLPFAKLGDAGWDDDWFRTEYEQTLRAELLADWRERNEANAENRQNVQSLGQSNQWTTGSSDDRPETQLRLTDEELEEIEARIRADRRTVVNRILRELRLQSTQDRVATTVRVGGEVRAPGVYPLEPGMRVSDLLRAGGSLAESAYVISAEVARYDVVGGESRQAALIEVDLAAIRAGDPGADLALQPHDFLNVKEVTGWQEQESVMLVGEVRFPGTYPIRRGETLASVVERAGGLTDRAFAEGAIFTRERIKAREAQQVRELAQRMEADLAVLSLQSAQSGDSDMTSTMAAGRAMLAELRAIEPVGRLALDLPRVIRAAPYSSEDLILEAGDRLLVPGAMQFVTVVGEVQSPTSLLFEQGLSRDQYISRSGGLTRRADGDRVYVVRANGQVSATGSRRWFNVADHEIRPGDTIVVPADIERMRPIPLWSAVTTIIYNLAVSVAAVNSF